MTPDRPDAATLLELAGETLRSEILPHLAPERRLHLLMSLKAIGIAARVLKDSSFRLVDRQQTALAALGFGGASAEDLADAIRHGQWSDPDAEIALYETLRADTLERLDLADPKYAALIQAEDGQER